MFQQNFIFRCWYLFTAQLNLINCLCCKGCFIPFHTVSPIDPGWILTNYIQMETYWVPISAIMPSLLKNIQSFDWVSLLIFTTLFLTHYFTGFCWLFIQWSITLVNSTLLLWLPWKAFFAILPVCVFSDADNNSVFGWLSPSGTTFDPENTSWQEYAPFLLRYLAYIATHTILHLLCLRQDSPHLLVQPLF